MIRSIGGGLMVIVLGTMFVVLARIDPSRSTRPWLTRRLGKHIGPDEADHILGRSARANFKLYTLIGWATIVAGGVAVLVGLVGAVG